MLAGNPVRPVRHRFGVLAAIALLLWAFGAFHVPLHAAEVAEVEKKLLTGQYSDAIDDAAKTIRGGQRSEDWYRLHIAGLLTVGKYPEALASLTNGLLRNPRSLRLRWIARDVYRFNGQSERATEMLDEIRQIVTFRTSGFLDAPSQVILGRVALTLGADPKEVLTKIYDVAQKAEPTLRDTFLARGELALEKHDYQLAAKAFQDGLTAHPDDADLQHGLALAYANSDREAMVAALDAALKANPKHLPSLLLMADHQINGENYEGAEKLIAETLKINPSHPNAWAYRAVLAHLRYDTTAETAARSAALKHWTNNPGVDHLIGLKLSQKYRFAEGAARQRAALAMDRDFLPAKAQLASDLLRLGDETTGWKLADEVSAQDSYDVAAYNLVTLHNTMSQFTTLTNAHFILRMQSREAELYGDRVLRLLNRARESLVARYGAKITDPTIVEIFHEQKDFGVRTFGMPENPGYLGVCFGRVVTANSPATARSTPVNWEAVLWHEYCHVVTLQMTANRMPRWLSEGISVYEEIQENPTWGQQMTPRYREMILRGELTPVGKLSSAFLTPKTPHHLQFAYYESCLVVEFIVQKFGLPKLIAILQDLRNGVSINDALARNTVPIATLESDFAAFAKKRAHDLAPGLDWDRPPPNTLGAGGDAAYTLWAKARGTNYYALQRRIGALLEEKKWADSIAPLQQLVQLYPDQTGPNNPYSQLALAYRALGKTNEERKVLTQLAERDDAAPDAYLRLIDLASAESKWDEVSRNAERFLAVNPLVPAPYRALLKASDATGQVTNAITAARTLLKLDPANPADAHFQLARLLHRTQDPAAKYHTLLALEDAPRHRGALQLLLALQPPPSPSAPPSQPAPTPSPKPAPDRPSEPQ